MASASFGCAGHVRPALWPRGCYCKHDWPQVDVLGCQVYRFLALLRCCSRSTAFTPSADIPHPTSYTQGWQTLPQVLPTVPTVGSRLLNCPGRTGRPTKGKVHTKEMAAHPVVTGWIFGRSSAFFQKHIEAVPEGPCSFVSQV